MKRYGNIYSKIYDIENLRLAHKNARKDKLFYQEVKMVDSNEEYYLQQIQNMLMNETYEVSDYTTSILNDKGKQRILMKLPYYPDRIIQWAVMLQIESIFMEVFCTHVCASIKNRGITRASHLTSKYMTDRTGTDYCLKMDVAKFYPHIDHTILKQLLRNKFKDNQLLNLLDKIINSTSSNGLPYEDISEDTGLPIGSYLSQFLANFYLAYFDHWLKEEKQIKYVVRYMDDIVIFHESKTYLHSLKIEIDVYLRDILNLKVKDNWQVFPTAVRGIDFVGYRHFYGYKLLRKTTCIKFKKRMIAIKSKQNSNKMINFKEWCSANSYKGWLDWCDSYRLKQKYFVPIVPSLDKYYIQIIKKEVVI